MSGRLPEISERNQERLRKLIKVEEIIKKLNDHVVGSAKMTNTMVRAAEILLRKVCADLTKVCADLTATALTTDQGATVPLLQIVRAASAEVLKTSTGAPSSEVSTDQARAPTLQRNKVG
jgi:deoxyribose-phosphate aldolase